MYTCDITYVVSVEVCTTPLLLTGILLIVNMMSAPSKR
jgi:hypothetical protein